MRTRAVGSLPLTGTLLAGTLLTGALLTACAPGGGRTEQRRGAGVPAGAVAASKRASADVTAGTVLPHTPPGGLQDWVDYIRSSLRGLPARAARDPAGAMKQALDPYLSRQEFIERYYEKGRPLYAGMALDSAVHAAELRYHDLLGLLEGKPAPAASEVGASIAALSAQYDRVLRVARASGARMTPPAGGAGPARGAGRAGGSAQAAPPASAPAGGADFSPRTVEVAGILAGVDSASRAYAAGDASGALHLMERTYLRDFEPVESRLPSPLVDRVERLIHLTIRPAMAGGAPNARVQADLGVLRTELASADAVLDRGAPFWLGAFNAFAIIIREGLEAVLLIGAILAYLAAMGAGPRVRRQIYAGVGAGVLGTLAVWLLARTVLPITGANRELMEGVTSLLAVGVLLYVSNWLFQKTYIQDWKDFLQQRVGAAAAAGSALAMAGLAFAAVFREGFETVLFYQALSYDTGVSAVLAGFIPGLLLIVTVAWGIIRLGVRLPLRRVFGVTNAILLYLGFVFVGKGIYNLQEAGLFTPHPVHWLPGHPALVELLGFYPIAETAGAQAAFVALVALTYVWYRTRTGRRGRVPRTEAASTPVQDRSSPV